MSALVLLYHALASAAEPFDNGSPADLSVVVDLESFREQLRCLSDLGKRVISLDDMLDPRNALPDNDNVVVTFDDGHKTNWSLALPALLEARATATFYIVAGHVDKDPDYLTSKQLRELVVHNMLIGSHSMTHRFLSELNSDEVHAELADSRSRLEDIVGHPVLDLAIPGGHYNALTLAEAKRCGYRSMATCKIGTYRNGDDPFAIPRVEIRRGLSLQAFSSTFNESKLRMLQAAESVKALLRHALGLSNYTRLRRVGHHYFDLRR